MAKPEKPSADADEPDARTRRYQWQDPIEAAKQGQGLGALAYLKAIMAKQVAVPPMAATLDFDLVEAEQGRAVFACRPAEFHYNPLGSVHGGLAATLIDSATGCCVQSLCPPGFGWTTLELKVNFVRAMTKDTGLVRCEGKIVHAGSRIATAEARLVDGDGKLYAHGSSTCMFFPLEPR